MKKINVDVYNQQIKVFESFKSVRKWISKKENEVDENENAELENLMNFSTGFAGIVKTIDGTNHWVIALEEKNIITLTHESLHMAYMMLDFIGVEHTVDNHEALCYLHHFIFGEAARLLKMINQ